MTFVEKVEALKSKIHETLSPLITSNYWLMDLPYHENIGDSLIWQGEMEFLKKLPHKCRGVCALETFSFPKIAETDYILFYGGGNFGDI